MAKHLFILYDPPYATERNCNAVRPVRQAAGVLTAGRGREAAAVFIDNLNRTMD